jgi:hypothetical protein
MKTENIECCTTEEVYKSKYVTIYATREIGVWPEVIWTAVETLKNKVVYCEYCINDLLYELSTKSFLLQPSEVEFLQETL